MTYKHQTEESELKILPIEQSVDSEAMLRHVRKLIDQELDYRREVTRYEMDGRTYLRIRLPECDCDCDNREVETNHMGMKPHKLISAIELVTELLANGPMLATAIIDAGLKQGLSARTMTRAKKAIGAPSKKIGDQWYWELNDGEGE
jgi:hypothetical protein